MRNKIKNFFKRIWEMISQIDLPDNNENLTREEMAEVQRAKKVQEEIHEQRSFAERVKVNKKGKDKVDPLKAKYGEAKPGNPIYDTAQRMNKMEEREVGE